MYVVVPAPLTTVAVIAVLSTVRLVRLKEGWVVSDAEREMVTVQQTLALAEQREQDDKVKTQSFAALNTAAQESSAQDRMREEARVGRAQYDAAEQRQKDEWLRTYLSSSGGKIMLRRLKLDPEVVDEATVLGDVDLVGDFARFVFNKTKAKAKGHGSRTRAG